MERHFYDFFFAKFDACDGAVLSFHDLPRAVRGVVLVGGLAVFIAVVIGVVVWPIKYLAQRYRSGHATAATALLTERGFALANANPCARVDGQAERYFVAKQSYVGSLPNGRPVTIVLGDWFGERYLVNRMMVPVTLPCVAAYWEPAPNDAWLAGFAAAPGSTVRLAKAVDKGALVVWREQPEARTLAQHLDELSTALSAR